MRLFCDYPLIDFMCHANSIQRLSDKFHSARPIAVRCVSELHSKLIDLSEGISTGRFSPIFVDVRRFSPIFVDSRRNTSRIYYTRTEKIRHSANVIVLFRIRNDSRRIIFLAGFGCIFRVRYASLIFSGRNLYSE